MSVKGTYKKVVSGWKIGNCDGVLATSGNQLVHALIETCKRVRVAPSMLKATIFTHWLPLYASWNSFTQTLPALVKQCLSTGTDDESDTTYPFDDVGAM